MRIGLEAHNPLVVAVERAYLLSVAIQSLGSSGFWQAYPSKCSRQTCLLLCSSQLRTEVYSLLSLGYFIQVGCYMANYRLLSMVSCAGPAQVCRFSTSVQVLYRCAGSARVCRSCTDIPYLVVWLFIQLAQSKQSWLPSAPDIVYD